MTAGSGNDTLNFVSGADLAKDVIVDGGAGTDTITFTRNGIVDVDDSDFVNVSNIEAIALVTETTLFLGANTASAVGAGTLSVISGSGNDTINLNALGTAAVILLAIGNDTITGGAGDDTIILDTHLSIF